jgi:hypothetical protein
LVSDQGSHFINDAIEILTNHFFIVTHYLEFILQNMLFGECNSYNFCVVTLLLQIWNFQR